jgi:uncharacterized protein (UPF0303 family)
MHVLIPELTVASIEKNGRFEFASLTNDEAVLLGQVAVNVIRERNLSLAVEVLLRGDLVFRAKLKTTGLENDPWLTGKAAVAAHFGEPSMLVKLRDLESGRRFEDRPDLDHQTLRAFGGAVPLFVDGSVVGTLTLSGEAEEIDHLTAVESLHRYFRAWAGNDARLG